MNLNKIYLVIRSNWSWRDVKDLSDLRNALVSTQRVKVTSFQNISSRKPTNCCEIISWILPHCRYINVLWTYSPKALPPPQGFFLVVCCSVRMWIYVGCPVNLYIPTIPSKWSRFGPDVMASPAANCFGTPEWKWRLIRIFQTYKLLWIGIISWMLWSQRPRTMKWISVHVAGIVKLPGDGNFDC